MRSVSVSTFAFQVLCTYRVDLCVYQKYLEKWGREAFEKITTTIALPNVEALKRDWKCHPKHRSLNESALQHTYNLYAFLWGISQCFIMFRFKIFQIIIPQSWVVLSGLTNYVSVLEFFLYLP
jgi:hypothetical protein